MSGSHDLRSLAASHLMAPKAAVLRDISYSAEASLRVQLSGLTRATHSTESKVRLLLVSAPHRSCGTNPSADGPNQNTPYQPVLNRVSGLRTRFRSLCLPGSDPRRDL